MTNTKLKREFPIYEGETVIGKVKGPDSQVGERLSNVNPRRYPVEEVTTKTRSRDLTITGAVIEATGKMTLLRQEFVE